MVSVKILKKIAYNYNYSDLINLFEDVICSNNKISVTYANMNTINLIISNSELAELYDGFYLIHNDGIGIFLAAKYLFGKSIKNNLLNGSDFYPFLANAAVKNKWKIFFFGDTNETLRKIDSTYPSLIITGSISGYGCSNTEVIANINSAQPDILIVGLGQPKQEEWIAENKEMIVAKIIVAVGDGIKVFAGTKVRGHKIFRSIGFEWLVRLVYDPKRLWKRYLIGIPLFLFRILKIKFQSIIDKKNIHPYET